MSKMNKIELLAPAGNLEKLKIAILYGADAVYLGGEKYGLRASSDNFNFEEMEEGIHYAHEKGKKVYLTLNIIPHNDDLIEMKEYITKVIELGIDAIILSDPGVYDIVKETAPYIEIHLSTQANNTNYKSALFWYRHNVKRIVLARELSFKEISEIRQNTPSDLELELFVHGAMCISYSGRCLLSNYMTSRDSNKGYCSHPCRWKYYLMEEKRPGEYLPVFENDSGTFIFNSKDLCMIEHIKALIDLGIKSLKIEGRMKSSFYVACVVKAYRDAIDTFYLNRDNYKFDKKWLEEVSKASHRRFTTGFYLKDQNQNNQIYDTSSYIREYEFLGIVMEYDKNTKVAKIEQRNRIFVGDEIEIMRPKGDYFTQKIEWIKDYKGKQINSAPHAKMIIYTPINEEITEYSILRKKALS